MVVACRCRRRAAQRCGRPRAGKKTCVDLTARGGLTSTSSGGRGDNEAVASTRHRQRRRTGSRRGGEAGKHVRASPARGTRQRQRGSKSQVSGPPTGTVAGGLFRGRVRLDGPPRLAGSGERLGLGLRRATRPQVGQAPRPAPPLHPAEHALPGVRGGVAAGPRRHLRLCRSRQGGDKGDLFCVRRTRVLATNAFRAGAPTPTPPHRRKRPQVPDIFDRSLRAHVLRSRPSSTAPPSSSSTAPCRSSSTSRLGGTSSASTGPRCSSPRRGADSPPPASSLPSARSICARLSAATSSTLAKGDSLEIS